MERQIQETDYGAVFEAVRNENGLSHYEQVD